MKTFIKFGGYEVNTERIGYLAKGIETRVGRGYYIAILVDGVELKEWFLDVKKREEKYKEIKSSIEYKNF